MIDKFQNEISTGDYILWTRGTYLGVWIVDKIYQIIEYKEYNPRNNGYYHIIGQFLKSCIESHNIIKLPSDEKERNAKLLLMKLEGYEINERLYRT